MRVRPHIPLSVKIAVAEQQIIAIDISLAMIGYPDGETAKQRLARLLSIIFHQDKAELHHRPPLRVRPYNPRRKDIAARYTPNANNTDHLIWLVKHDHHIETNVRGHGAQFPDRVLIKRERRRERKPRPKMIVFGGGRAWGKTAKIANQINPWPPNGSRKLRSRQFRG